MSSNDASQAKWFGHPRGLSTLFFTEMWERFSYYGMRALLLLFMTDTARNGLGWEEGRAAAIYGLYTFAVYALALPGGWMADRLIGRRRAVLYGGILIAAGQFTLAVPAMATFYLGLFLIAVGTGLLKPNVSAVVADLYPEGGARRDAGFSIFYMGINIGALFGPLLISYLGENIDWHLGLGAAGIGMTLGIVQYVHGGKYLGDAGHRAGEATDPALRARGWRQFGLGVGLVVVILTLLVVLSRGGLVPLTLVGFAQGTGIVLAGLVVLYFAYLIVFACRDNVERKRVGVIAILFLAAAMFWSGYEQAGSSMNLFAQDYTNRVVLGKDIQDGRVEWHRAPGDSVQAEHPLLTLRADGEEHPVFTLQRGVLESIAVGPDEVVNSNMLLGVIRTAEEEGPRSHTRVFAPQISRIGLTAPAGWLQSIPALFVILLAPVVGTLWVRLGSRNPSIPVKFFLGLLLLGSGFFVLAWGSQFIQDGYVSPMWLITTYFFHTVGELCLSPVGLSSITKLSPDRLTSQMMGTWFMGAALGNLIAGLVAGQIENLPVGQLFLAVASIAVGAALVILLAFAGGWARPTFRLVEGE